MGHASTKWERLNDMQRLLADHRWTVPALADALGVTRQTIYNYFTEPDIAPHLQQDESDGTYWIDRAAIHLNLSLTEAEALVAFIALRRQQRQTLLRSEAVAGALSKVARALRKPMMEQLIAAANRVLDQEPPPSPQETLLTTIVRAWSEGLALNIRYQSLRQHRAYADLFHLYWIETTPWGDGVYVVGYSTVLGCQVTYKLERIERASLSSEPIRSTDTDDAHLQQQAWGIWASDDEPQMVRLRFAAGVPARRVRESVWHPTAQRLDLPDGSCELMLSVGDTTEILPWIRGWGADVEVLEPSVLRNTVIGGLRAAARLYQITMDVPTVEDTFTDFFGGDA